jgi:hypothetical protein
MREMHQFPYEVPDVELDRFSEMSISPPIAQSDST